MKRVVIITIAMLLLFVGCGGKQSQTVSTIQVDLNSYFKGVEGCFVLYDVTKQEYKVYNEQKSIKRVSPCSSFKILNSLIGLETKVVADESTVFKWDGKKYPIDKWNTDHSLKTAVSNSVVWYFQQLASNVGEQRMQDYLHKIDYGNNDISGGITKFWLQSSLKISPKEQVEVLKKFYNNQLPFSKRNIDIVKKVILLSDENGIKLSGKTGSGTGTNSDRFINGWFVGYVEKGGNVYIFATNIEAEEPSKVNAGGVLAKEITLKILKDIGCY